MQLSPLAPPFTLLKQVPEVQKPISRVIYRVALKPIWSFIHFRNPELIIGTASGVKQRPVCGCPGPWNHALSFS